MDVEIGAAPVARRRVIAAAAGGALLLVAVLAAGVWLLRAWGDDGFARGLVFAEGQWLRPPYRVEADGLVVRVNGAVVRSRTAPPSRPTPGPVPTNPATMSEVLTAVAGRLRQAGGANEREPAAALVSDLESFARTFAVVANVRREPSTLVLVGRDGEQAYLYLRRPAAAPEGEMRAALVSDAEAWQRLLDAGGALVAHHGAVLTVPGPVFAPFARDLREAFNASPSDRQTRLLDVLGSVALTDAVAAAGPAPKDLVTVSRLRPVMNDGVRAGVGSAAFVMESRALRGRPREASTEGDHDNHRTPASNRAYVFTPVSEESITCHSAPIAKAAELHSYQVVHLDGAASSVAEFAASSGRAGLFYSCIHGGNAYEMYEDQTSANAAQARYKSQGLTGTYVGTLGEDKWYVVASPDFIRAHWQSANSIVHVEGCSGANLNTAFNAREYISTFELCAPGSNEDVNTEFWGRLAGTVGEGRTRSVGEAFKQAFQGTIFQLFGTGGGKTVLVPAVRSFSFEPDQFEPDQRIPVSPTVRIRGEVRFDAEMDRIVSTPHLMVLEGCDATIVDRRWLNPYTYEFWFTTKRPGALKVTVSATWATSSDDLGLHLDGNLSPARTDHVGPSFDNWERTVQCVAELPTPTPERTPAPTATTTPPRTPATPTAAPTVTPQPGVGLGTTVPRGQIVVFVLDGRAYLPTGLTVMGAHPPACAYEHVHGGPIRSLTGGRIISEHLGNCGYGPPNFAIVPDPR